VSVVKWKSKSRELDKRLDHTDFKARDGWFSEWKCRFATTFKKPHGEVSFDVVSAKYWKSTKLPDLLQKFCPVGVCKADDERASQLLGRDISIIFLKGQVQGFRLTQHCFE
jgi:hypothetical protein